MVEISKNINKLIECAEEEQDKSSINGQLINKLNKGKVLIVDDMLMHLETAKLYLEMSGFKVSCASDTLSAWDILKKERPDLVLLDVVMPGENGLDLLLKIQSQYPTIGIIIMTAFGSEDIAVMALKHGALDYIRKPFKYSNLGEVVEKVISKQRQIIIQEKAVKNLKHEYEELQVSAESILQCMSDGVVAVDNNLRIRIINQKAEHLFNVKKRNIIGKFFYEVFPSFKNIVILHDTLENERGIRLNEVEFHIDNGLRLININTDVILDYNGEKIGAVAVFNDNLSKSPELENTSINEILREILPIIDFQAFSKKIILHINAEDIIPEVLIDPGQIKQVILNLIQNTMESMKNGGTLDIETKYLVEQNEICLEIKAIGSEISIGGTELELSNSFIIVEQHKGRIEVRNQGYGKTFFVCLPVK